MLSQIVWVMFLAQYCLPKVAKNCQEKAKSRFSLKLLHGLGRSTWPRFTYNIRILVYLFCVFIIVFIFQSKSRHLLHLLRNHWGQDHPQGVLFGMFKTTLYSTVSHPMCLPSKIQAMMKNSLHNLHLSQRPPMPRKERLQELPCQQHPQVFY